MKALPLLACLALLAPQAFAQAAPATRDATLAEIDAWRHGQLVHLTPPDPLTDEFEPLLNKIEVRVQAAQNEGDLAQPRIDFKAWQHDLLVKKLARIPGVDNLSPLQRERMMNKLSKNQREQMRTIAAQTEAISQAGLRQTSAELFDGGGTNGATVAPGSGGPASSAVNSSTPFPGLHVNDVAPPPSVTSSPLSLSSLWNYIDQSRGYKVAEAVFKRATGFAGWCYASVKEGFIAAKDKLWAKIKDPTASGQIGIPPGLAVDYQRAVNSNPALLAKLGYRRVDVSTIPGNDPAVIPSGTILDFKPGCAGYSSTAGHIEIIGARSMLDDIPRSARPYLTSNEVLACSDGCHGRTLNYIRTYGKQTCMSMYVPVKDVAAK